MKKFAFIAALALSLGSLALAQDVKKNDKPEPSKVEKTDAKTGATPHAAKKDSLDKKDACKTGKDAKACSTKEGKKDAKKGGKSCCKTKKGAKKSKK